MNRAQELLYHNHLKKQVVLSTVSGILTTEPGMIQYFAKTVPSCDIITTKSYQVVQTFGHREPVLCSVEEGNFGNFVGLRNPGMDAVYPELEKIVKNGFPPILNISLSANEVRNFITLVRKFDKLADMLELNFSCPHAQAGFGASIGSDAAVASDYVRRICREVPERHALLIIKLTPNVENIGEIARAVIEAGADGVAAINTVGPLKHIDPVSGSVIFSEAEGGKGGASGEWVKQKALDCVREIRLAIGDEPILLGMGGVSTPADVRNMLDAGADSVGIGSVLSRLEMKDYENYFSALKNDESVSEYIVPGNKLQYRGHTVLAAKIVGGTIVPDAGNSNSIPRGSDESFDPIYVQQADFLPPPDGHIYDLDIPGLGFDDIAKGLAAREFHVGDEFLARYNFVEYVPSVWGRCSNDFYWYSRTSVVIDYSFHEDGIDFRFDASNDNEVGEGQTMLAP